MTSFQSSELTELPVVENSQLFAQRAHIARYAPCVSLIWFLAGEIMGLSHFLLCTLEATCGPCVQGTANDKGSKKSKEHWNFCNSKNMCTNEWQTCHSIFTSRP